ncbi:hypothetical protein AB9F35_00085 [Rhizobium leguminosarum]|uniref:hypothetical protein n=1 Tax=Rhizobium leguminosarum TaxID=384 RepID=UPI003F945E44
MARMTCASLPRPLPGRHCIVLSRTAADDTPNVHSAPSRRPFRLPQPCRVWRSPSGEANRFTSFFFRLQIVFI